MNRKRRKGREKGMGREREVGAKGRRRKER